jgi:hypothetical protein
MLFYGPKRNIAPFWRINMRNLFAGALALSFLLAGAASAQTDQPRPDQPGAYQQSPGYHQDQRAGYDQGQQYRDNGDGMGRGRDAYRRHSGYRHDQGHRVCHWNGYHHYRVCHWYH